MILLPRARASTIRLLEPLRPLLRPWPDILPAEVGDFVRPFAPGVPDGLFALLSSVAAVPTLDAILTRYRSSKGYLVALTLPGTVRFDLSARAVAPVDPHHAETARRRLER